jgi:hypothetical protein
MSADFSRERFDARNDFCGVLMQQGRVQLDADWNELVEILDRRWRAETTDVIGRAVVPRQTPDGFKIVAPAAGQLTIGPGRIYVDGLLAENHGRVSAAGPQYDPVLGELRGTDPVPYDAQPYLPGAPALPGANDPVGPYLVYLDVWEREVTYLEDPDLIESAVGVDTTARLQTVWQVRLLSGAVPGLNCATPDDQIPHWPAQIAPSGARLTTSATPVASPTDPCVLPPAGGYRGLENQLYRVEIHDAGSGAAPPTFKWSRDNASVVTAVTGLNAARDQLTVVRTGRDAVLRINTGDWVEVTDDHLEFAGRAGILAKVKDVHDDTRTVFLAAPLPAGTFPADAQGNLDAARHTRLRRWDQKGQVLDVNNNVVVDLDAAGSTGAIPVSAGTTIVLENGVLVSFSLDPAGGGYRAGDYWVFAARTAGATVEALDKAPPRGVHHHYCRLAAVTFPTTAADCRVFWPPDAGGAGCDCTACVTVESHTKGTLTIQQAIDRAQGGGGVRVCLEPGIYAIGPGPLLIRGLTGLRLSGHGEMTVLLYSGPGPAIEVDGSQEVTLEDFQLVLPLNPSDAAPATPAGAVTTAGVWLNHSRGVTVQRCRFVQPGRLASSSGVAAAIALSGLLERTAIRECAFYTAAGLGSFAPGRIAEGVPPYLLLAGLDVVQNFFSCYQWGVRLDGFTYHYGATRIAGNVVATGADAGIVVTGQVVDEARLDVADNEIRAAGDAVRVGTSNARVNNNDVGPAGAPPGGAGVVLAAGLDPSGIARCQVIGNRIRGVTGNGVSVRAHVVSAMIKQNFIDGVGGGGIVMEDSASADVLSIANNEILNVGALAGTQLPLAGIQVFRAVRVEVASNSVRGVGVAADGPALRAGILVLASGGATAPSAGAAAPRPAVRIAGNLVTDVGPPLAFDKGSGYGIRVVASFDRLEVVENVVRRSEGPPQPRSLTQWTALAIAGAASTTALVGPAMAFVPQEGHNAVGFFGGRFLQLPPGIETLAVRGNRLDAYGMAPGADIVVLGSCVFAENQCQLESPSNNESSVVAIQAGAIVAGQNVVKYVYSDQATTNLAVMSLRTDKESFTVVGNLTNGAIQVNGAALAAPWAPLNVKVRLP